MDRNHRRDDRRYRDDGRSHKPRYEQERSRSPARRDRRDDRRRERSPRRDPPTGPSRSNRDMASERSRNPNMNGQARRPNERQPPKDLNDSRPNGTAPKTTAQSRGRTVSDAQMEEVPEDEDSEAEMQRLMGFKNFRTTKNTKVPGNDKNFAIYKVKKSEYRQYMNRTGGFNRPLSPSRE